MNRRRRLGGVAVLFLAVLIVAGCVTPAQFLDSKQGMAVQTAVTRGQFEMSCPTATGEVLSREIVQPPIQGPWVGGVQRAEYTVGVSGCDKQHGLDGDLSGRGGGCFAAGPADRVAPRRLAVPAATMIVGSRERTR